MNMFKRSADQLDSAETTDNSADLPVIDKDDELENLLAIPVSQEIPSDFTLIGYNRTMRNVEEILSQANKRRNPLVWGGPGVGKTALMHGLVMAKNNRNLSMNMYKRTFYRLNTSKLLHANDVVEINLRFDTVLASLGQYDVLGIENIYTLLTHLKARGANGVLVGLLEGLSRRKFQAYATCSTRDKQQLLIEVPELHEYFVPEQVPEPDNEQLLAILRGNRHGYEQRYGIKIPDVTLRTIRDMTQKYHNNLEEWAQPNRAMIVLDRSIARFSVEMNSKPEALTALENEREAITNEMESLASSTEKQDKGRCQVLQERLTTIEPEIEKQRSVWDELASPISKLNNEKSAFEKKLRSYLTAPATEEIRIAIATATRNIARLNGEMAKVNLSQERDNCVLPQHILDAFSDMIGLPLSELTQTDKDRMLHLEDSLGHQVFDQPEAISAVAKSIRVAKAGLGEDNPPHGSFLFLGPSGVGKTEGAKAVAQAVANGNLVRLDMSEYMEKHTVSRLIGSPPGYSGSSEGGILTNAVLARPNSVVLFDEIEKAHEDIQLLLLQVMDYGRLTDARGVDVQFGGTYIILTANVGGKYFLDESLSYEAACEAASIELKGKMRPEIMGRIDAIIGFRRLQLDTLKRIARRRIGQIAQRLEIKHNLKLTVEDDDIARFCVYYKNDLFGGRPILTALKQTLTNDVAMAVFAHAGSGGSIHAQFETTAFAPIVITPE